MVDGLTEGQQYYLREEYKQALPKLKEELELARRLDTLGIDPEGEDPRVLKTLIVSLEGEISAFDGQPGVLDFVSEMIVEQKGVGIELRLLSVLEESSNEGVQFIAGMLRDVIEEGTSETRHTYSIGPYRKASKNLDNQYVFLEKFGTLLESLSQIDIIPTNSLEVAIELHREARAGFEEGTPARASILMNQSNAHHELAERGQDPIQNFEQAIKLHREAKEVFEEGTPSHARTLANDANTHIQLAEREQDPIENLNEAIELHREARVGFEEGTPSHARTLTNKANAHRQLAERGKNPIENLTEAIALYSDAKEVFEEETPDYVSTLTNEASAHRQLAEWGKNPIENLTEAIALHREARAGYEERTPDYARTLTNEASAHHKLAEREKDPVENLTEAIELHREARAGYEERTPDYARTLAYEADAHHKLAERGKDSVENFTETIELSREARAGLEEETSEYVSTLGSEANARHKLAERGKNPVENLTEAIELHREARVGFEENTSDYSVTVIKEAHARSQLAERGENPIENSIKAIKLYKEGRVGFEEGTHSHASTLTNEAIAHRELGKLASDSIEKFIEAIELHREARAGFDEGTPGHAHTLMNEANARQHLATRGQDSVENLTEAIELHREARAGFEEGTPNHARALANEAIAHKQLAEGGWDPIQNFEQAIELHREARAGFEEYMPAYATTLLNEGNVHRQLAERGKNPVENFTEAEAVYTNAKQIFDASINFDALRQVNENLGRLYRSWGKDRKAYESYESAIEAIEEMRETVRFRDNREEFFTKHISVYHSTVLLALTLDKSEEALNYAERAKGRIFLDQLADTQVTGDIPEELAEQEQELKEQIAQLRRELDRDGRGVGDLSATAPAGVGAMSGSADAASQAPMHTAGAQSGRHRRLMRDIQLSDDVEAVVEAVEENREEKEAELKEARQDLEEVQADIREHDPEAYTLRSVDVASLAEIRAGLGADEQLLEYFVADERLVIFLVDHQELATEVVSLEERGPAGSLQSVIDEYRMLAKLKDEGEVARWQELGKELYELLIAPVEEELHSENLTIVPHGGLHVVPFAALYDGECYLVERYKLRVLANASTLRFLDESGDGKPEDVLVVGDPREESDDTDLAHARREAETVAELHDAEALIGPEARKEVVQERIETADLAHLACHAQYDTDEPALSSVVLADTDLLLADLFELEMEGELVTLAACETAYGEVSRGDEVQSLTRGFQFAGASGVIGTLWRVADEATPELFREFYTADGNRAERLRQAQLSFIQAEDLRAHPYFWSGFQLYGIS